VVAVAGNIRHGGADIFRFKIWKIDQYFLLGLSAGQYLEHVFDADTHPTDARASATWLRVNDDAVETMHGKSVSVWAGLGKRH